MSIYKNDLSEFKNNSIGFTVLQTDVMNMLDAESLGVWAYLCSKPSDWIIRKSDILTSLKIGKTTYSKVIKNLVNLNLIRIKTPRDQKGRCIGRIYEVTNILNNFTDIPEKPTVGENRCSVKTDVRENGTHTKERYLIQKKDSIQSANKKEIFAKQIRSIWNKKVVECGIKKKSSGAGVTTTNINNIQKIIKFAKDEGSTMDYSKIDTWHNYFSELFRICANKAFLQSCVKTFSWAVKPNTYQKLADDTYLSLEKVA